MRRLTRPDPAVLAAMKAAVAAYTGPVQRCPPGAARGHEFKESNGYGPPRPEKPAHQDAAHGNGRRPRQPGGS
jgi:hypothetical protein